MYAGYSRYAGAFGGFRGSGLNKVGQLACAVGARSACRLVSQCHPLAQGLADVCFGLSALRNNYARN